MQIVTKRNVSWVLIALVLVSAYGAYQGFRKIAADDEAASNAPVPTTSASMSGAKTAAPLVEPIAPTITEAQVRDIARQEVRAALAPKDPVVEVPQTGEEAARPAGASPAPAPAPARPAAPGAAEGAAPLF